MSINVERMGMACNRIVKSGRKRGDSWGRGWQAAEIFLLWWFWHLGLEDSKLIPHTFFDILFHTRCQNKSITGLEDRSVLFSFRLPMLGFLENMFKNMFIHCSFFKPIRIVGAVQTKISDSRDLGDLRSSTSHDGSTSPFVACDASTEFWEPCLGTCNGPSHWYGTGGGWLKNKKGLFSHDCIYLKYQTYIYIYVCISIKNWKWKIVRTWNFNLI